MRYGAADLLALCVSSISGVMVNRTRGADEIGA